MTIYRGGNTTSGVSHRIIRMNDAVLGKKFHNSLGERKMSRTKDALIKPRKRKGRQEIVDKRPDTQCSPPSRFTGTVILSRGKKRRPDYHRFNLSYERLAYAYGTQEAQFILNVEEAWDRYLYDDDFGDLLKVVERRINFYARRNAAKFYGYGLTFDDFKQTYLIELWRLAKAHNGIIDEDDRYLYEKFHNALIRRGLDIVRKSAKIYNHEVPSAELLAEIHAQDNTESDALTRLIIRSLPSKERWILSALYDNPDASNREIARRAGLRCHKQVPQIIERIRRLLA